MAHLPFALHCYSQALLPPVDHPKSGLEISSFIIMHFSKLLTAGAIATLSLSTVAVTANTANALTLKAAGTVSDGRYDDSAQHRHNHAFTFGGMTGNSFIFTEAGGAYEVYQDGSDRYFNMTGTLKSRHDSSKKWEVDLWFKDSVYVNDGNAGTAKDKLELKDSAYVENGGNINPNTWKHWDIIGFEENCSGSFCSSIEGAGSFDGLGVSLTQRPGNGEYTFQSGQGANGKNSQGGFSGWFDWTLTGTEEALESYGDGRRSWRGDINVTLSDSVPVPEPTVGLLGLAAAGLAIRKQKKNGSATQTAEA